VVRAMDGPIVVVECAGGAVGSEEDPDCGLHGLWREVNGAIEGVLDGVTIEDLVARQLASRGQVMYHI